MPYYKQKTLGVVGAGPKGIAVAVKAKVLEEFGYPVDKVILIEKNGAGANWSGDFGYTNGKMKLGTSPEKDVVFPLETNVGNSHLNKQIRHRLLQFSWTSFLIQTYQFSDWVDRGRPAPSHMLWSQYLHWVSEQLEPQVIMIKGEVVGIDLSSDSEKWELSLQNSEKQIISVDRLMLTGPGKTRLDFTIHENVHETQGLFDLESFWSSLKNKYFLPTGRVAIVGAGENAASTLLALSEYSPHLKIDVISPKGFISTRAENFYENQFYSQPERNQWRHLEISDRLDFIERTDLGVFSHHAMTILNEQNQHQIIPGRVVEIDRDTEGALAVHLEYGKQQSTRTYDQLIIATGFDQVALLKAILSPRAINFIEKSTHSSLNSQSLRTLIQEDLSVRNLKPHLHLPMLAGLMQGPGFGNLSCLGRLSDRILIPQKDISISAVKSTLKEALSFEESLL